MKDESIFYPSLLGSMVTLIWEITLAELENSFFFFFFNSEDL